MPVSRATVTDLFRQVQAIGRAARTVAGREPYAGLRLGAATMLGQVESAGEIRGSVLADHLGLDTSVVSRQLSVLEGLGLTTRRPDPADGRAWLSHVTPAGRALLAELRSNRLQAVEEALAGWDEDEALALVGQLVRLEADLLHRALRREGQPAGPAADGEVSTGNARYSNVQH